MIGYDPLRDSRAFRDMVHVIDAIHANVDKEGEIGTLRWTVHLTITPVNALIITTQHEIRKAKRRDNRDNRD
jgi:hypothetical protein